MSYHIDTPFMVLELVRDQYTVGRWFDGPKDFRGLTFDDERQAKVASKALNHAFDEDIGGGLPEDDADAEADMIRIDSDAQKPDQTKLLLNKCIGVWEVVFSLFHLIRDEDVETAIDFLEDRKNYWRSLPGRDDVSEGCARQLEDAKMRFIDMRRDKNE